MKKGIVTKATGSWYDVRTTDGETMQCKMRGKFRKAGFDSTNPVVVGDHVTFDMDTKNNVGVINDIADRTNHLIRRSTNLSHRKQVIAANIDTAFLVVTLVMPQTHAIFIDRFLVMAEIYKIPVVIVFNKADLFDADLKAVYQQYADIYETIGYPCLAVSAQTGENLDKLKTLMKDKVSIFAGNSGVGKSSLINAIEPTLQLKTGNISSAHFTGKHTTSFAQMFRLSWGADIVDTPGVRSFGMVDMQADDIAHNFREMFEYLNGCKYNNCTHTHEPNCAVKTAVEQRKISLSRYNSYLSILLDDDDKYRQDDYE